MLGGITPPKEKYLEVKHLQAKMLGASANPTTSPGADGAPLAVAVETGVLARDRVDTATQSK